MSDEGVAEALAQGAEELGPVYVHGHTAVEGLMMENSGTAGGEGGREKEGEGGGGREQRRGRREGRVGGVEEGERGRGKRG